MFTGWRGKIGRSLPESLMRRLLGSALVHSTSSSSTIKQLQMANLTMSVGIANELDIEFTVDDNSGMLCVDAHHWQSLKDEFSRRGFTVERLESQFSFAARSAWSVAHASSLSSNLRADLRALGAMWQVYPGPTHPPADAQDFVGSVDAVYTWVNASDPSWAENYKEALRQEGKALDESAAGMARFTSRDELLFSLRSLEMNLPWIDKVYLVTAGQRPSWLVDAHPRLVLVDHAEIFSDAPGCLPTFNSHAIESQLANIKGLKEHFLYINDDVFFGCFLHPNTFFGPAGQAKYSLSSRHFADEQDSSLSVNRAAANNRTVVAAKYGRTTSRKFKHVAHPQRLAVHRKIQEELGDDIEAIARNKFRNDADLSIPSSLAHQFAARMGLGYPTNVDYQYLDIGSPNFYLDVLRFARKSNPAMFCINEVVSSENETDRAAIVRDLLMSRFPLRSSFEK